MSKPYTPPGSIREQLLNALDPGGQMQRELDAARRLPRWGPTAELRRLAAEHEALLDTMVRYWAVLTDRGWGVANVGVDLIRQAGLLIDRGDEAGSDEVIATWFDPGWISRTVARVEVLTDGTASGRRLFAHRARLLTAA